eukprot:12411611-Karenia_brevis.AAC.1
MCLQQRLQYCGSCLQRLQLGPACRMLSHRGLLAQRTLHAQTRTGQGLGPGPWENHGKIMQKPWKSYGKSTKKLGTNI